jgi:hypothetical protein
MLSYDNVKNTHNQSLMRKSGALLNRDICENNHNTKLKIEKQSLTRMRLFSANAIRGF